MYPQPMHMLAQMTGGPDVVTLRRYLEDRVGQSVHFRNYLRPETLPRMLQTRRL